MKSVAILAMAIFGVAVTFSGFSVAGIGWKRLCYDFNQ